MGRTSWARNDQDSRSVELGICEFPSSCRTSWWGAIWVIQYPMLLLWGNRTRTVILSQEASG